MVSDSVSTVTWAEGGGVVEWLQDAGPVPAETSVSPAVPSLVADHGDACYDWQVRLIRNGHLRLLEFGWVLGAAGSLVAVEEREYSQVFGPARSFLGADHVGEVGDHDHDVSDADLVGACG
jgi:hypothetical protein